VSCAVPNRSKRAAEKPTCAQNDLSETSHPFVLPAVRRSRNVTRAIAGASWIACISGPRLNAEPANLVNLIACAYNLKYYQVVHTPPLAALNDNFYDVVAKAMDDVLKAIENSILDRPVVDRTGLNGTYNVRMAYMPNIPSSRGTEPAPEDISVFTEVEVQLGLKLEAQKGMVEVLVVDRLEKPSEN
jgi:hypothetical protein